MNGSRTGFWLCVAASLSACGGNPAPATDRTRAIQALLDAPPAPLPQEARFNLRCGVIGGGDFGLIVVRPGGAPDSAPDSPFAAPTPSIGENSAPPFRGQAFAVYARSGTRLAQDIFADRRGLLFAQGNAGGIQRFVLDRDSAAILMTEVFANKIVVFRAYITDGQLAYLTDRLAVAADRARRAGLGPVGYFLAEQQSLASPFRWAFAQNRNAGILSADQVSIYQCVGSVDEA